MDLSAYGKGEDDECALDKNNPSGVCSPDSIITELIVGVAGIDKKKAATIPAKEALKIAETATGCDSESCVIRTSIIPEKANKILNNYFKPPGPRDTIDLFDNFAIDSTLEMYTKKYKGFLHVPMQMIDFMERGTELAKIQIDKIIDAGYKSIGCILNTDVSSGRGIHWFSVFCDLNHAGVGRDPYTIEYFNSSGRLPMSAIHIWANQKKAELEAKGMHRCEFIIATRKQQQQDHHSCGPYSVYYIWSRLEGVPHSWFDENFVTDKRMLDFRKHLFRKTA